MKFRLVISLGLLCLVLAPAGAKATRNRIKAPA